MLRILFILFVLLPLLELYVLIEVGSGIGGLTTIVLCLLTAALGGLIIRVQGLQTLLQARQSMAQAQHHELAAHAMHGFLLVVAGVLLFIPGFISDTLGFLLLVPPLRSAIIVKQQSYTPFRSSAQSPYSQAKRHANDGSSGGGRYVEVIDVEVIKKDTSRKD